MFFVDSQLSCDRWIWFLSQDLDWIETFSHSDITSNRFGNDRPLKVHFLKSNFSGTCRYVLVNK